MQKRTPMQERFWSKVEKGGATQCWEWIGCDGPRGFGYLGTGERGKSILAHRYSYVLHYGEIPKNAVVRQTCGNRRCVNPEHLSLGEWGDNARRPITERFWAKVQKGKKSDDCWVWTGSLDSKGYSQLGGEGTENLRGHRLSYILANGSIKKGASVLHRCDNRQCVNPSHLFLGTQLDNIRDMIAKGRNVSYDRNGARNPAAKSSEAEVRRMRQLYLSGKGRVGELAEMFGLDRHQVSRIVHGKAWRTT